MKQKLKKLTSLILVVTMMLSIITITPIAVNAAESEKATVGGIEGIVSENCTKGIGIDAFSGCTGFTEVNADSYSINYPTKEEIIKKAEELNIDINMADSYKENYSLNAPDYVAGELSDKTVQNMLNLLNFFRFIAGLPSDVEINEEYSRRAQAGALVNAANKELSHYPDQPDKMDYELYELGAYGTNSSNLACGYDNLADALISGWMDDSDFFNIDRVGHRRWVLNPDLKYTGFGRVESYYAMYAIDFSRSGSFEGDYVAWPAPNTPSELFQDSAFSVNLGDDYDFPSIDNVTVEVSSKKLNKSWKLDKTNNVTGEFPYLNVDNNGYGMKKCIIFRVGDIPDDDTLRVKINGITQYGVEKPIEYNVNLFSISTETDDKDSEPTSIKLNQTSLTLGVGESYTLTKSVSPSNASTSYTWNSSNTSVATVSNGKVTAKNSGTANITVKTSNGKTATCKVTVKSAPTSVKTNPASVTLGVGETYTVSENTNSGSYANAANLKWSSSNTSVATVTKGNANKATITAKGVGTAYIKITLYNGKTAQCKVTVKSAPTSVKTNPSSLTLGKGETYTISENTNSGSYSNAANLKWSTSNSNVATVTKGSANKATITAKGVGTAYIKITLYNGKTAQCKVIVKSAPSSVKTNPTSVTLGVGETYTVSENTNSGSYANASNLKWSTSNSSVATVTKGSANKATITAKGVGTAYIKITLYNGKTVQCKVTVKNAPSSVSLSKTILTLSKGATYTISETTNSGSYANASNLKWTSTNSSVATVTKGSGNKAVISAKAKGTAYIKITLYNGKTAQCKVTVK